MVFSKLKFTDLTEVEFLQIPPSVVLRLFDVGCMNVWLKLPLPYRMRKDFQMESFCWGHWRTTEVMDGPVIRKKNCPHCMQEIEAIEEIEA